MDNQHRLITGYAELDQEKIDLMNEISEAGKKLEALLEKVNGRTTAQRSAVAAKHAQAREEGAISQISIDAVAESKRLDYAQPERWAALARTELQTGLMFLKRAVAQPQLF